MFDSYAKKVAALAMEPLRITCTLSDDVVIGNGLHFDAILSYAIVEEITRGEMMGAQQDYVRVPLPLEALWESEDGVPLWASTDLLPTDEAITSVRYWHRRSLEPHMSTKNLRATSGPYKERRTPIAMLANRTLMADVIGAPEELARLLSGVTAIGKKRTGVVEAWNIDALDTFELFDDAGRARRPIPAAYLGTLSSFAAQHISFSPPYWHYATRLLCIPTGAAP